MNQHEQLGAIQTKPQKGIKIPKRIHPFYLVIHYSEAKVENIVQTYCICKAPNAALGQ